VTSNPEVTSQPSWAQPWVGCAAAELVDVNQSDPSYRDIVATRTGSDVSLTSSSYRTLARLTDSLGAKLGANGHQR